MRRDLSPFRKKTDEQRYKGDSQMTGKQRVALSYFHHSGDFVVNPSGNNILGWVVHDYKFNQHEANVAHLDGQQQHRQSARVELHPSHRRPCAVAK